MQNQNNAELDQLAEELTLRREVNEFGGICYYNEKNECHRLDGPAVISRNGDKHWYQNGKRHRLDGPAAIHPDGSEVWYQNDKRHRLDGPAVIYPSGRKFWYIDGVPYSEEQFNAHPLIVQHRAKTVL